MRAVVCLKQVIDPLTPASSLSLDQTAPKVTAATGSPEVINGFDEQALEAAVRLREDAGELEIIAVSVGDRFDAEVMKRALAAGADDLVLVQDATLDTWDSRYVAVTLAATIRHIGGADLVLCGRQASDWDNALVPIILAEELGMPCLTLARRLLIEAGRVEVERVLGDESQLMSAELPAVVTVTSELGELRFPTVRERLAAARRQPRRLLLADVAAPAPRTTPLEVLELAIPITGRQCQFVEATDPAAAGARLADVLLETRTVLVAGDH